MKLMSDFDREYFIQARKEIDTEKRERDHILNIAVVVLGALGFAFIQNDGARQFVQNMYSFLFEISVLTILTSLFFIRWMKLRQIADRWYSLYRMLNRYYGFEKSREYMETIVIKGFKQ